MPAPMTRRASGGERVKGRSGAERDDREMRDQEHQPEASHRSKRGRCEKGTCNIPDTRAQHKDEHDEHDREGSHNARGSWTEHGAQS